MVTTKVGGVAFLLKTISNILDLGITGRFGEHKNRIDFILTSNKSRDKSTEVITIIFI